MIGSNEPLARANGYALIAIAALVLQFAFQSFFFPLGELLSSTPLTHIDGAFHLYRLEVTRRLCEASQLVGYDPFFAAGQLSGITYSSSSKIQALLSCVIRSPDAAVIAYKAGSFGLSLLGIAAIPIACALIRVPLPASVVAASFGFVLWWASPFRWYHTAGMASFVAAAFLSLPYSAWLARVCVRPAGGIAGVIAVSVAGAIGVVLHPLFGVCVAPLTLALLFAGRRSAAALQSTVFTLLCVGIAVAIFNAPWLYDVLRLPGDALRSEQPYQRLVDPLLPVRELLGLAPTAGGGSRFYLVILAGCLGLFFAGDKQMRKSLLPLIAAGAFLIALSAIGAAVRPLGNLVQPNRFAPVGWLFLVIPSAVGITGLGRQLMRDWAVPRWRHLLPFSLLVVCVSGSAFYLREVALEIEGSPGPRYGVRRPEVKQPGPLSASLIGWIRSRPADDGRILFEMSLGRIHDDAHMAGPYALWTQREFIGGPYPFYHFANFHNGMLFGRPIRDYSPGELKAYLDLYNVTAIVCHSDACKAVFAEFAGVSEAARFDPLTVYQRHTESSYVLAGSGRVTARRVNRVDVETDAGAEIVLKYHWVPGLATDPPLRVEHRNYLGDPQPFIVVKDPARRFSIYLP